MYQRMHFECPNVKDTIDYETGSYDFNIEVK